MSIDIVPFRPDHEIEWDQFCSRSINGTFQHTRRFLNYHKDRFRDASVLLLNKDKIVGSFPAAVDPNEDSVIVSHPGATYGGITHQGWLLGQRMIDALAALSRHYARGGFETLIYKAVPPIYTAIPAQDDIYALFRAGAARIRCDLSCTLDLSSGLQPSTRRKRALIKANKSVQLTWGLDRLEELWSVVSDNLAKKYGAKPVHSPQELRLLAALFPENILSYTAMRKNVVVAGAILFNTPSAWHVQYTGSSDAGQQVSALDAVIVKAVSDARNAGARYFDFGTSNEQEGQVLNQGLFKFKSEFGAAGMAHEFYKLSLE